MTETKHKGLINTDQSSRTAHRVTQFHNNKNNHIVTFSYFCYCSSATASASVRHSIFVIYRVSLCHSEEHEQQWQREQQNKAATPRNLLLRIESSKSDI